MRVRNKMTEWEKHHSQYHEAHVLMLGGYEERGGEGKWKRREGEGRGGGERARTLCKVTWNVVQL